MIVAQGVPLESGNTKFEGTTACCFPTNLYFFIYLFFFFFKLRREVNNTGVKMPHNLYSISNVGLFMSPSSSCNLVVVVISSSCKVALIDASGSQQFLLFRSIFSAQLFSAPFSLIPHCTRSSQTGRVFRDITSRKTNIQ